MTLGATLLIVGAIAAGASVISLVTGCGLEDVASEKQDPMAHIRDNNFNLIMAGVLIFAGTILFFLGI